MTSISNITSSVQYIKDSESTKESFNDKVLNYLQHNKPEGKLNDIIVQMRALSPDKAVSMHQITDALLYADTYMRHTDEYKDYTHSRLDKCTFLMLGVNMFFNNMMHKNFAESNSDIPM